MFAQVKQLNAEQIVRTWYGGFPELLIFFIDCMVFVLSLSCDIYLIHIKSKPTLPCNASLLSTREALSLLILL